MISRMRQLFSSRKAWLFGARISGAAIGLVTQVLMARLLPADQLGLYFFAISLATVLGVAAAFGYPGLASRILASTGRASRQYSPFVRSAATDILMFAIAAALIGAVVLTILGSDISLILALSAIPALSLGRFFASIINLDRRALTAYLPDLLFRPLLLLAIIGGLFLYGTIPSAGSLAVIFSFSCWLVAIVLWRPVTKYLDAGARTGKRARNVWRLAGAPLVVVAIATSIYGDAAIAAAGAFLPSSELAVFAIAMKISLLVGFATQISQQTALPDLADAVRGGSRAQLLGAWQSAVFFPAAMTLAALAAVLWQGELILSIFGSTYVSGKAVLVILLAAQLARALLGPGVQLAVVTGQTRALLAVMIPTSAIMFAVMAVLVLQYGILAAAICTSVLPVAWSAILLAVNFRRYLSSRVSDVTQERAQPA